MTRGLALAILLACVVQEARSETWAVLTLTSYHADRKANYNERNLGAGIESGSKTLRIAVGGYHNSVREHSYYAALSYTPFVVGEWHFGVLAGGVNGYPNVRHGATIPLAAPIMSWEGERFGVNILGIPQKDYGVVGLQVKIKF